MQYRRFGRLDWDVSVLGFGCMRLPTASHSYGADILETEAAAMLRRAIDCGVNYVDTAYPYHGGESEKLLGRVLGNGYRAKVKIATKFPTWLAKDPSDFDRYFNEQLQRLQTGCIDFYLLHGLDVESWPRLRDMGFLPWAEQQRAAGRIGHLGFSFHDKCQVLKEIVDGYDDWTVCLIQYNYMDAETQAGRAGLEYAAARGLAVAVMEPLAGGRLTRPPPAVERLWDSAPRKRTPAEWALHWVWDQPEVSVVLSGMGTMRQLEANLAAAESSRPGLLTASEARVIAQVRDEYRRSCPVACTECEYCLPCPHGVNIPRNFRIYNDGAMYGDATTARGWYANWLKEGARAEACQACRDCEPRCPQRIPIAQWMSRLREVLAEGQPYPTGVGAWPANLNRTYDKKKGKASDAP
jgi:hypothetical protein